MSVPIQQIPLRRITGEETNLGEYKGKVVLVVNVASQCGLTPQYEGLQVLYEKFRPHGFEVLAFPCNQFGGQEPGDDMEIARACTQTFGVTFPLFAKIEVSDILQSKFIH